MRHAFLLLALAALLALPGATAHAVLQSAEPGPNGHAEEGVSVIEFRFTEDVERDYTDADLVNLQGESLRAGPVEFASDAGNVIRLPVQPLASGIYAASWRTLSVDSHTARGTFVFSVGNATLQTRVDPAHDHSEHSEEQVAKEGSARAAFYTGLFLALGLPLFGLVVVRDAAVPRPLLLTAFLLGLVGALAAFLGLLFLSERTGLGLGLAAGTAAGRSFAWRGGLLALSALAALAAWRLEGRRRDAVAWSAVALALAALVATSLGSHAAAVKDDRAVSILADILHLAMGAVWIGGVVGFLHVAWGRDALDVGRMVTRFSPVAVASVVLLLATGTYASARHMPCLQEWGGGVPCVADLRTESYVRLVALKVLLLVPLVGLGWFNQKHVGPRLARNAWSPRALARVVQVEAGVMLLILVAAGVLASTPPPDAAVQEGAGATPDVLEMEQTTEKSHVILQVSPSPVTLGTLQRITVIVHPLGPQLPNGTTVALKLQGPGEPEPDTTLNPERVAPNEWTIEDSLFTSPGTWKVTVLLQRPDEYKRLAFEVPVVPPGQGTETGS